MALLALGALEISLFLVLRFVKPGEINVPMALFSILMTAWKVPKDETKGDRPHNDYPGMVVLTSGLVALMIVVYQAEAWGWSSFKTLGLSALAIVFFWLFPVVEKRAREPLIPSDIVRNHEVVALCFCAVVICQLFFIVLLYFTQYAMKFLGDDPMWAGARVVQFMLSFLFWRCAVRVFRRAEADFWRTRLRGRCKRAAWALRPRGGMGGL